jgi:hypothetical protein
MFTVENARSVRRFPHMTGVKTVEMRGAIAGPVHRGMTNGQTQSNYIGGKYEYENFYQYTTGNNGKLPQIDEDRKRKD